MTNAAIFSIFKDQGKVVKYAPHLFAIGKYYPKGSGNYRDMDEFSGKILDIKKDEEMLDPKSSSHYYYIQALDYFKSRLNDILSHNEEFIICVMPSHNKGTLTSGIRTIAESLCCPPRINGTKFLCRNKKMPEKHLGGNRNLEEEIDSLSVQNNSHKIIKDKIILLLDDVTTTGITFDAGIYKLKSAGACEVIALALGKTTY